VKSPGNLEVANQQFEQSVSFSQCFPTFGIEADVGRLSKMRICLPIAGDPAHRSMRTGQLPICRQTLP
jgi:hypothetical protein